METKWILTVMLWCCYYAHRISCPKFICDKESQIPSSCAWKERKKEVLEYHFKACKSDNKPICDWRLIHEVNSQCVEYMTASLYPGEYCKKKEECLSFKCGEKSRCIGSLKNDFCNDTFDCQPGLFCFSNKCIPTVKRDDSCNASNRCGVTDICEMGKCVKLGSKNKGYSVENPAVCASFYAFEGKCQDGPTLLNKNTSCPTTGVCNYISGEKSYTESCVCAMKNSDKPVCLLGPGDVSMAPFTDYLDESLNEKCNLAKGPLCLHSEFDKMDTKFFSAYIAYEQRLRSSILEESEECVKSTINSLYTKAMTKLKKDEKKISTAKQVFLAISVVTVFIVALILFIMFFRKKIAASEESAPLETGVETTTH